MIEHRTFDKNILNRLALLFRAGSFVFLSQLGKHEGPDALKDAGEHGISGVDQPSRIRRVL